MATYKNIFNPFTGKLDKVVDDSGFMVDGGYYPATSVGYADNSNYSNNSAYADNSNYSNTSGYADNAGNASTVSSLSGHDNTELSNGAGYITSSSLTPYFLLAGRATPQTAAFGTASGASTGYLTSTSHATKGKYFLNAAGTIAVDELNLRIGLGLASPAVRFDVLSGDNTTATFAQFLANNVTIGLGIHYAGIRAVGSNANNPIQIDGKGTGEITLNQVGTGNINAYRRIQGQQGMIVGTGTDYSNVLFNQSGLFDVGLGGSAYGIYTGNLTLGPSNGAGAYFQYFGGTVLCPTGETIATAVGSYIQPIIKSGSGALTNTYGIYQASGSGGLTNYGAYFADFVGIGTQNPTEALHIVGNINVPTTTSSVGIYKVKGFRFMHSFGTSSFFGGKNAGNLTNTGTDNVGIGEDSLSGITTGYQNCAMGQFSLRSLTTGNGNFSLGAYSMANAVNAVNNVAIGIGALQNFNATGSGAGQNVAIGRGVLQGNGNFSFNTGIGDSVLNVASGSENTSIGAVSGQSLTSGSQNVFVGTQAGMTDVYSNAVTTGIRNIYIGATSGPSVATQLNYAVAIGFNAKAGASNTMALGGAVGTGYETNIISGGTTASAKLHLISLTEQLRVGASASVYWNAITNSTTGVTTFDAVGGTSPSFVFNDNIQTPYIGVGIASSITTGLLIGGTGYTSNLVAATGSLSPTAGTNATLYRIAGTIVEAGSGTHNLMSAMFLGKTTVTAGSATVNNTASLYIEDAMSATVTGVNYAIWVDDGITRLDGTVIFGATARFKGYTVASLPAGTQGDKVFVTDALAPTYLTTVVGGGAIVTEVFYNGTNWVCT